MSENDREMIVVMKLSEIMLMSEHGYSMDEQLNMPKGRNSPPSHVLVDRSESVLWPAITHNSVRMASMTHI